MKLKVSALKCEKCGNVFVPRGEFGARKCPKCGLIVLPTRRPR